MDINEEISNIAKKRVLEKEKQNQYDQVREKIQQITDFNGQIHEDPDKNTVEQVEDSDIVKELSDLQEMQDIQTIKPIETTKRGFARPIALRLRGNIQNEVRFALDPIVEKQVEFNSKILNLINNLESKHQELIDNLHNSNSEHRKLIEQQSDTLEKHQQNINLQDNSSLEHKKLAEQHSDTLAKNQQFMDQLRSTSSKQQELLDQLCTTLIKHQEQMAVSNEKFEELSERYDLQQRVIHKLNRAFDQHQDIFTKFFQMKKAKKRKAKTTKRKTSPRRKVTHKLRKVKKRTKKRAR